MNRFFPDAVAGLNTRVARGITSRGLRYHQNVRLYKFLPRNDGRMISRQSWRGSGNRILLPDGFNSRLFSSSLTATSDSHDNSSPAEISEEAIAELVKVGLWI